MKKITHEFMIYQNLDIQGIADLDTRIPITNPETLSDTTSWNRQVLNRMIVEV